MNAEKKYCAEQALIPIWSGDTVYHESVMFLGNEYEAQLLYEPDEVLSVLSSDLLTEFVRGRDWDIRDGRLIRLPDSAIPAIPADKYYLDEPIQGKSFGCTVEGHKYIAFSEGDTFAKLQIAVSYRHKDKWNGFIPNEQRQKFARFFAKLEHGEEVTVLFYGDSITTGGNSSSTLNRPPYAPTYPYMITSAIAEKYGYTVSFEKDPRIAPENEPEPIHGGKIIHYINTAVGGRDSRWGLDNIEERACAYKPDLFILAFGMNDGSKDPNLYMELNIGMIDKVRASAPDVDICLVATMLPHWRVAGFFGNQKDYESALEAYAYKNKHMAVAPMTSMHKSLLEKKEFYTMTGNNVNHCNDFLARVYAMTVLKTLGIYDWQKKT